MGGDVGRVAGNERDELADGDAGMEGGIVGSRCSAARCQNEAEMATTKKPRRTAERILEISLDLFNRYGEPNVSTTLISAELGISPGNLYYHYPAKDELINALFARFEKALGEILPAADGVENVEDAWLFFHMLFELIWLTVSSTATSTTCSARTAAWRPISSSC